MIEVHYNGTDELVLQASKQDTNVIRRMMSTKFKQSGLQHDLWTMPATLASFTQLENCGTEVQYTVDAAGLMVALEHVEDKRIKKHDLISKRLSPLQADGVVWMATATQGGILADQMGTGKTVQACQAMNLGKGHVLVVTTKTTLYSWMRHIKEWTTGIYPIVLHGTPAQQRNAVREMERMDGRMAVITTHATASKYSNLAAFGSTGGKEIEENYLNKIGWNMVFVDEMHKLRNPAGKQARALKAIRKNSKRAYALTGTPVTENPDDIWHLLNFVAPRDFPSRSRFRERYCIMYINPHGGVENLGIRPDMVDEFDQILSEFLIRRLRSEVFEGLPTALDTDYRVLDMPQQQQTLYNKMAKDMMAEVEEGKLLLTTSPLTLHARLDNISSAMPVLDDDGNIVSLTTPSNKLDALLDIAEERDGDPFVVFAPSRKLIDFLAGALRGKGYKCGVITGQVNARERAAQVEMFQAGKLDIMLMTSAGGEGITLTAADLVVYADLHWSAVVNQQVADRIDRHGQTRPPQRIVLLSKETIDESRRRIVLMKEGRQQEILQDKERLSLFLKGRV